MAASLLVKSLTAALFNALSVAFWVMNEAGLNMLIINSFNLEKKTHQFVSFSASLLSRDAAEKVPVVAAAEHPHGSAVLIWQNGYSWCGVPLQIEPFGHKTNGSFQTVRD